MARPSFIVESDQVATCWEQLHKLLQHEQDKKMIDDLQQSIAQSKGLEECIYSTDDTDGHPVPTIKRIKPNLGIDRDVSKDIEEATEAYNLAVCRTIGPAMHSTLPRELRDIIYAYLTTLELDLSVKPGPCPRKDLCGRVKQPKSLEGLARPPRYTAYFAVQPRSKNDGLCSERYWRDDVVSAEVASELVESWYRNSTFYMKYTILDEAEFDECFKKLLNEDRFGTGLNPRELITKFKGQIWLDDKFPGTDADVLRCVDSLSLFRKVTKLQVLVGIAHWDRVGEFRRFLRLIRPTILRLRTSGYHCTVSASNWWDMDLVGDISKEWEQELEAEVKNGDSTALHMV
ncbi:hypothetical protein G6011_00459 [Alternaria panax]|uniref:Uncharacterized protein n=1 Tax=Alternaria panax TaxID=48097 RepID=A0AAD4NV10_9PLEO|nr:hypothetical protein G6011_00459 [Alternaria panax]